MGSSSSKIQVRPRRDGGAIEKVIHNQSSFDNLEREYPIAIQIAHYTPSSFPLTPVVTKHTIQLCKEAWQFILEPKTQDGQTVSGLTIFYSEFYDTLDVVDKSGKFESMLLQHSTGLDKMVAKGAILLRIINYALHIDPESEKCRFALYTLGKSHNNKQIRPWQYSVFIQVMLTTLSTVLCERATHEVMAAWMHLFAFILRNILPAAIRGLVEPGESNIDITQELGSVEVTDEVIEADKMRNFRKKMRSKDGSRLVSGASSTRDSVTDDFVQSLPHSSHAQVVSLQNADSNSTQTYNSMSDSTLFFSPARKALH